MVKKRSQCVCRQLERVWEDHPKAADAAGQARCRHGPDGQRVSRVTVWPPFSHPPATTYPLLEDMWLPTLLTQSSKPLLDEPPAPAMGGPCCDDEVWLPACVRGLMKDTRPREPVRICVAHTRGRRWRQSAPAAPNRVPRSSSPLLTVRVAVVVTVVHVVGLAPVDGLPSIDGLPSGTGEAMAGFRTMRTTSPMVSRSTIARPVPMAAYTTGAHSSVSSLLLDSSVPLPGTRYTGVGANVLCGACGTGSGDTTGQREVFMAG